MAKRSSKIRAGMFRWLLPALAVLFLLPLFPNLVLLDGNQHILRSFAIGSQNYFELQFIHSVNKGTVTERYHFDKHSDTLWLDSMLFEQFGAGMLDDIPQAVTRTQENGMMKLTFDPAPQISLDVVPGTEAKQTLTYGATTIALYELSPYQPVQVRVLLLSAADLLLKRVLFVSQG
jgi:hypothetical protein